MQADDSSDASLNHRIDSKIKDLNIPLEISSG